MATAAQTKARAKRDAARKKGRKNTKLTNDPARKGDPTFDLMGAEVWNAADLSIGTLELKTVDRVAKKKASKASRNKRSPAKKAAPRRPAASAGSGTKASQRRKEQRKKGRKKTQAPPEPALAGKPMSVKIHEAISEATIELTMEGASVLTLTLDDPDRALEGSGLFDRNEDGKLDAIDVKLDKEFWFRLVKVTRSGMSLTLTFEDRGVAYLRSHNRPKYGSRDDMTRAEFVRLLVKEVKADPIRFYCPELLVVQPKGTTKKKAGTVVKVTGSARKTGKTKGSTKFSGTLYGKEGKLSAGQVANARKVLAAAAKRKAGPKATLALVEACIIEAPDFKNPTGGDDTSVGILQLLNTHLGGSTSMNGGRRDIDKVCGIFLTKGFTGRGGAISLAKKNPGWNAGQVAQAVQGSAHPERYHNVRGKALRIIEALGSAAGAGSQVGDAQYDIQTSTTRVKQFRFSRGTGDKREDSWTCIKRNASDVRWAAFMRAGALWYVSEDWLLRQEPIAVIDSSTRWVDEINYDWDDGKDVQEVSLVARAERWAALPGTPISISEPGPAYGKWLVSKVSRSLFSRDTSITLKRKTPKKREPAPETVTTTSTSRSSNRRGESGGGASDNSRVGRAYAKAFEISERNLPYLWGGGHGPTPSKNGGRGLDCSGWTSAVLHAGGMQSGTLVSGGYANWGKPGRGKHLTVWYNGGHVWIEFTNVPGKKSYARADTSPHGSGPKGPKLRYGRRSTSGFRARHYPGT